jgi:hypothetical protein
VPCRRERCAMKFKNNLLFVYTIFKQYLCLQNVYTKFTHDLQ